MEIVFCKAIPNIKFGSQQCGIAVGPASRSGTPLGLLSRHASGVDASLAEVTASGVSNRSAASRGGLSRRASGVDASAGVTASGISNRSAAGKGAVSRQVSGEVTTAPETSSRFTTASASRSITTAPASRRAGHGRIPSGNSAGVDSKRPAAASGAKAASAGAAGKANGEVGSSGANATEKVRLQQKQLEGSSHAADTHPQQQHQMPSNSPAQASQNSEHALHDQGNNRVGASAETLASAADMEQQLGHSLDKKLPSIAAIAPLIPTNRSVLKSAASLYAASGVVDDLFIAKERYVNGGAEPMTKARHHYGLSPREIEEETEKRKQFAYNLGAWYKAQLQRRARINTPGTRAMSRSNSKVSD